MFWRRVNDRSDQVSERHTSFACSQIARLPESVRNGATRVQRRGAVAAAAVRVFRRSDAALRHVDRRGAPAARRAARQRRPVALPAAVQTAVQTALTARHDVFSCRFYGYKERSGWDRTSCRYSAYYNIHDCIRVVPTLYVTRGLFTLLLLVKTLLLNCILPISFRCFSNL